MIQKITQQSLHLVTRKYRQLLYTDNVHELFPIWKNDKVYWIDEIISPIEGAFPTTTTLLTTEIIKQINGFLDTNHKMTIITMACEIFAAKNKTSLLHELKSYSQSFHLD